MALPVKAYSLFGGLTLDESKLLLFSSAEKGVLEDKHIVILFDFVEIVHVELVDLKGTCLTKEEKLEWRKYLGRISLVKETTSMTANPTSSLSQHIIFLFSGCFVLSFLPLKSHRF